MDISEERLEIFENRLVQIRKLLLGMLLLAKDILRDRLKEDSEVLRIAEEAEEAFIKSSPSDRFQEIENTLDIIQKRIAAIFRLLEETGKNQ
ncbi:MAG: hypothetical protein AB1638_07930 [Nitrospirota bacterium]